MKNNLLLVMPLKMLLLIATFLFQNEAYTQNTKPIATKSKVKCYLTTPSKSSLLQLQAEASNVYQPNDNFTITINPETTYQTMDGFGYSLTGGSAFLINKMTKKAKIKLLNELFGQGKNSIGISYIRISIGASDLDANVFSYNDLPLGQTDINLSKFSIAPDATNLIPILQLIKKVNPTVKILGSPWSAPTWMKTNQSSIGGELNPMYYETYANYFVKYIQEMKANGIAIDAITIQNEPENPNNNPSMVMTAEQQTNFIKNHLGPIFQKNNIITKIITFDHNLDNINYPMAILDDVEARKYVDGSAFHLYAGNINNMSLVHNAHPDKNVYFTEQWMQAPGNFKEDTKWHFKEVLIGATRNWSKTVLEWNLAADANSNPHTKGGCTECLGAITIQGDAITRNPAYYVIAHASKFIKTNSIRIASNYDENLPNVAFKTPEGNIVVIVLNTTNETKSFNIKAAESPINTSLPAGAVTTYVWEK